MVVGVKLGVLQPGANASKVGGCAALGARAQEPLSARTHEDKYMKVKKQTYVAVCMSQNYVHCSAY